MTDRATAVDIPPVVAWAWACFSAPYFGERASDFNHQDARTERLVREASGILVRPAQLERSQIHSSARRADHVPTSTSWSSMNVRFGFPARIPRIVARFGTALRRGESVSAAASLATQWVQEVARVRYAFAWTTEYLRNVPASLIDRLVDWKTAGPFLARRVGGEDDGAARALVHCDRLLMARRIGTHEGLGGPSHRYALEVTAMSAPPTSGFGALRAAFPHWRKRTRGAAERPPALRGDVRRKSRAGPSPLRLATRPTFAPPGVPFYAAPRVV